MRRLSPSTPGVWRQLLLAWFAAVLMLGHASPMMTQRYAHLADATTRRALDEVDGLISGFVSPKTAIPAVEEV